MNEESQTYGAAFADVYDDWYANVTNVDDTVETLVRLAGGGSLLELGVGTGRIAVPLAARLSGRARVTGIDESPEMLAMWRTKLATHADAATRSEVVLGDMAGPLPNGPYTVVFCTFNTFFNLPTHDAQRECLRNAVSVLAPGGAIVLEFAVFPDDDRAVAGQFVDERLRPDGTIVVSTSTIDPGEHTASGRFTDAAGNQRPWVIRYVTPRMLAGMAHDVGLVVTDQWEDFGRRPFLAASARQVCVLRRRLKRR
ncbi:MAG: class I SAM-dependent methyltransferase [Acidobacteria bacterium]|nr:class I SAM-dependent methyltransferase [Acidobacteriota bacterium]